MTVPSFVPITPTMSETPAPTPTDDIEVQHQHQRQLTTHHIIRTLRAPIPPLPREIVDHILDVLVDSCNHDPAYQWIILRQLSKWHKYKIEAYFKSLWMPQFATLLLGRVKHRERRYHFDDFNDSVTEDDGVERFVVTREDRDLAYYYAKPPYLMQGIWYPQQSMEGPRRVIVPSSGASAPNHAIYKRLDLIDIALSQLEVTETGASFRFHWKHTFTILLRREIMRRKIEQEPMMLKEPCQDSMYPIYM